MTTERAIEILDPEHREKYDGIKEVNEACRMGMAALAAQAAADENEEYLNNYARICADAVTTWGNQAQILMVVEEMAELTKALLKFLRYGGRKDVLDSIQEERADVQIMLNQLTVIFGGCEDQEKQKLARLEARIKSVREAAAGCGRDDSENGSENATKYNCTRPEAEENDYCIIRDMEPSELQEKYAHRNPCADCVWGRPADE